MFVKYFRIDEQNCYYSLEDSSEEIVPLIKTYLTQLRDIDDKEERLRLLFQMINQDSNFDFVLLILH